MGAIMGMCMKELSVTAILKRRRGRIWFHCIGLAMVYPRIITIRLTPMSIPIYSESQLGTMKVSNAMFMRKDMVHEDDYWRCKLVIWLALLFVFCIVKCVISIDYTFIFCVLLEYHSCNYICNLFI